MEGFRFNWYAWTPKPGQLYLNKERITDVIHMAAERQSDPAKQEDLFLKLWQLWKGDFPGKLTLVTLTNQTFKGGKVYQLRFWFGEPNSFKADYVDSAGENLIVHMSGYNFAELKRFVEQEIIGGLNVQWSVEEGGVLAWRMCF